MACRSEALAKDGGEGGIRTLDSLSTIHAFQACALVHYATPPLESVVNPKDELTDSYALPKSQQIGGRRRAIAGFQLKLYHVHTHVLNQ